MMRFRIWAILLLFAAGCTSTGGPPIDRLVVGVAPTAPPIVFEESGEIRGVEADLARMLAGALNRDLEFRRYPFADLLGALERGEVDVLMSGVSITAERSERVLFSEPYMQAGQLALIRAQDVARLGGRNTIRQRGMRIGYERASSGEDYVAARLPRAKAFAFDDVASAIRSLRAGRIDFFVHDAPTIWAFAGNPTDRDLLGLYRPLTEEFLGWAVQRENIALQQELNKTLSAWKERGVIETILGRWVPVRIHRR